MDPALAYTWDCGFGFPGTSGLIYVADWGHVERLGLDKYLGYQNWGSSLARL